MKEFLEMGVELRRMASMEAGEEVHAGEWKQAQRKPSTWWAKGWETMRIPRLAFAFLMLAIIALGSGLVVSKVRAQAQGRVLMLNVKLPSGAAIRCPLSLVDNKWNDCTWLYPFHYQLGLKVLSSSGDQIELGVRARYTPNEPQFGPASASFFDIQNVEEKQYDFRPGERLEIDVPGWGAMILTGELMDHMPPSTVVIGAQMDPNPRELQLISPVLLRDHRVLFDFEGGAVVDEKGASMYDQNSGLWILSLSPLEGSVEAESNLNRVTFQLDGHSYVFLMGAPVVRSDQHVWVLHDPDYREPSTTKGNFIGGGVHPPNWKRQ
jgi:hypothetical protein